MIHLRQEGYYQALAQSDQQVSPFIEFMLGALLEAMAETATTDQVTTYCGHLGPIELGGNELMQALGLSHR